MKLTFALFIAALAMTSSAFAQTVSTWIIPANVTTNYSQLLAPNQVMEVLSLSLDETTTTITVTANDRTIVFGTGGTVDMPQPLVVAGPATVSFGRTTSSDDGSLLTFRVSQLQPAPAANAQASPQRKLAP